MTLYNDAYSKQAWAEGVIRAYEQIKMYDINQ
jgi:hypothetical protein